MATELEMEVMTRPIVRHYRGATRADVEQAYRVDAQPAIAAGYQPVSHLWTQDGEGLLLVVTYQGGAVSNGTAATVQPAAEAPTADERYRPPADYYRMPSDAYAPAPQAQPIQQAQSAQTQQQAYAQHVQQQQLAQQQLAQQQAQASSSCTHSTRLSRRSCRDTACRLAQQYAAPQIPQQYVAQIAVPVGQTNDLPHQVMVQAQLQPVQAPIQAPIQVPHMDLPAPGPTAQTQAEADARRARLTVQTMDLHTAGEPLRIIRSGFPDVPHLPVLERRRWVLENADYVRRAIIQEPRGHRDMYGAILLPPYNDYADMTVLFMHNEGYSTMCGHGIIAITTGLIEEGLFPAIRAGHDDPLRGARGHRRRERGHGPARGRLVGRARRALHQRAVVSRRAVAGRAARRRAALRTLGAVRRVERRHRLRRRLLRHRQRG